MEMNNIGTSYLFELEGRILKINLSRQEEKSTERKSVIIDYDLNGERAYSYKISREEMNKICEEKGKINDFILINYVNKILISDSDNWFISCIYILSKGKSMKLFQKVNRYKISTYEDDKKTGYIYLKIIENRDEQFQIKITNTYNNDSVLMNLDVKSKSDLLFKLNSIISKLTNINKAFEDDTQTFSSSFDKVYSAVYLGE